MARRLCRCFCAREAIFATGKSLDERSRVSDSGGHAIRPGTDARDELQLLQYVKSTSVLQED